MGQIAARPRDAHPSRKRRLQAFGARELHTRALRNRSQAGFHSLRIGIKRFRYIVENFLPEEHKRWGDDLKHMQDLLGEVHYLDVLWTTAIACHIFPGPDSKQAWRTRIQKE